MNRDSSGQFYIIAGICLLLLVCGLTGVLQATFGAVRSQLLDPHPTPPSTQQISAPAVVVPNGDAAARYTGYELVFPKGTADWRVTYESRCEMCGFTQSYTINDPTYWCRRVNENRWLSCQPVIRAVEGE